MLERSVYLTLLLVTGDVGPYPTEPLTAAREIVALIDSGEFAALPQRMSEEAARASATQLRATAADIHATHGPVLAISTLEAGRADGVFEVVAQHRTWTLSLELTREGVIDHLELKPGQPLLERSGPLGLPFREEWWVMHGGPDESVNHHADVVTQRRAADLNVLDSTTSAHRGDGKRNTDYFAYGRDVVAMADGVVVMAIDGVHENTPNTRLSAFVPGNMVLLAHEDGLHTHYAHLIPGSLQVEVGDRVVRGQVLGKCGNSGRSTRPHLHVQAQDGPSLEKSWGVEMVFDDVWLVRDGERTRVDDYTVLRGDILSPGSHP